MSSYLSPRSDEDHPAESKAGDDGPAAYLDVKDSRTGKTVRLPIENGAVNARLLAQLVDSDGKNPVVSYDPGLFNTAVCQSKISQINGEAGTLHYRGYAIEDLAHQSTFLEVAYLLLFGSLPAKQQLADWETKIMRHTFIHENLVQHMKSFRYDAHPLGMTISTLSALATFYPEANPALKGADIYLDEKLRNTQIYRLIGKLPTVASCAYRHRIGRPFNQPVNHLSYTGNFLYMLDRLSEANYTPDPRLARALDVMFILHAEHGLNCSTAAMRHIASTRACPVTGVAAATSALFGPLHGGANEAALHMLREIGSVDNVPAFLEQVKAKKKKLMGFGHRVYRNYDPRARIIKEIAEEVFEICGRDPLIDIAEALEEAALKDEYFISRRLYPNLDFYSGLVYTAMGLPPDMFPLMFAIGRTVGWLAHWVEQFEGEQHIYRPKQLFMGQAPRKYTPVHERSEPVGQRPNLKYYSTGTSKRSGVVPQKGFLSRY